MRLPGMHTAHLFQSTPLSLAETLFIFGGTMTAQISIHSAIASGDEIITLLFGVSKISIHSAIASGDPGWKKGFRIPHRFQSTPLSLAETFLCHLQCDIRQISIHSAIASGDGFSFTQKQRGDIFQSTPLSLAETRRTRRIMRYWGNFNPLRYR